VLGQSVGLKFEVDPQAQASPAPATGTAPAAALPPPVGPAEPPVLSIKITPELIESLRREPLVQIFMDQLGAQIVKVE
jgi:hypothetical protein